jgi:hypothetical protein
MSWARQHPIEMLADWAAPALFAAACGWATRTAFLPPAYVASAALLAFAAGAFAMRIAGGPPESAISRFEPVKLEPEELLLEEKDQVLLLDDPLVDLAPDARVVRLFARQEPTPGELVDRIADFLGEGGRAAPEANIPADASAALHSALANIRASLR